MIVRSDLSQSPPMAAVMTSASRDRPLPVPMLPSEIIRIETACFWSGACDKTIRDWAKKDGIGRQAGRHAPLQISFPALLMRMDGEAAALERLRNGDRADPVVAHYLSRAIDLHEAHLLNQRRKREVSRSGRRD